MAETYDIKKAFQTLYAPRQGGFHLVEVPELSFLMVEGHGDPNSSGAYAEAVASLYGLSYAVRATARSELGKVHTVGPLEGLWSAEDPQVFAARGKGAWDWTMMISQPDWITAEIVETARAAAVATATAKGRVAPDGVRFADYDAEGASVQVLHVGSCDDEGPVLVRLHHEYLPEHGLTFNGRHHEIYLSAPRRTQPPNLRTVLRQPVTAAG